MILMKYSRNIRHAVAVAGYFFGGANFYIQIFEGAKMSILAKVEPFFV